MSSKLDSDNCWCDIILSSLNMHTFKLIAQCPTSTSCCSSSSLQGEGSDFSVSRHRSDLSPCVSLDSAHFKMHGMLKVVCFMVSFVTPHSNSIIYMCSLKQYSSLFDQNLVLKPEHANTSAAKTLSS